MPVRVIILVHYDFVPLRAALRTAKDAIDLVTPRTVLFTLRDEHSWNTGAWGFGIGIGGALDRLVFFALTVLAVDLSPFFVGSHYSSVLVIVPMSVFDDNLRSAVHTSTLLRTNSRMSAVRTFGQFETPWFQDQYDRNLRPQDVQHNHNQHTAHQMLQAGVVYFPDAVFVRNYGRSLNSGVRIRGVAYAASQYPSGLRPIWRIRSAARCSVNPAYVQFDKAK